MERTNVSQRKNNVFLKIIIQRLLIKQPFHCDTRKVVIECTSVYDILSSFSYICCLIYSKVKPEEMTGEMRFREDLGFTSLDFMSFLGELEDTFDIELDENEVTKITTLEEALKLLEELQ